jgi:flagella synthesis protein FlgN
MAFNGADLVALEAEVAAFRDLVVVLRTEQDVLRRADADALSQLVPAKEQKLAILGGLARKRSDALRRAGFPDTRAGMDSWLASGPHAETGRARFGEILELARDARSLNVSSQRLAAVQYRHFERAGAALRRAAGQEDVYGADGRPRHQPARRELAAI